MQALIVELDKIRQSDKKQEVPCDIDRLAFNPGVVRLHARKAGNELRTAGVDDEAPGFFGTLSCLPFQIRNRFVNGCANGKQVKATMPGGNLLKTPQYTERILPPKRWLLAPKSLM